MAKYRIEKDIVELVPDVYLHAKLGQRARELVFRNQDGKAIHERLCLSVGDFVIRDQIT